MGLRRTAEVLQRALASELAGSADIPLTTKLRLWRSGFKSDSYRLFDLAHNAPGDYVSDLEVARAGKINGAYGRVLKNKLLFASLFSPHCAVPEIYGIVERGQVYPISRAELTSAAALLELSRQEPVILKPAKGNKGKGVLSLSAAAEGDEAGGVKANGVEANGVKTNRVKLNAEPLPDDAIIRTLEGLDGYLIVARVQQAPYADAIFAGATNTIRVITLKDPESGEVYVPAAIHRFGTALTAPTDNFQTGGLSAAVEVASGVMGRAAQFPSYTGGELKWVDAHPDTGAPIAGATIPRWAEAKATVIRLVETFPFLKYVGWDVAITERAVVIIEGNHNINLGLQVHGPLLRDPRARKFFEHYGVLGGVLGGVLSGSLRKK